MSNYNYNPSAEYSSDNQHIYYNLAIENAFNGIDNGNTNDCVYEKQTPNILTKQSDYELCVDSWQVRAKLPILICPIKEGITGTDVNLTPYSVTYEFTTGGVTTNFKTELIYLPDPKFTDPTKGALPNPPSQNNGIQDLLTNHGYYWLTKYNTMVKMINTALTTSYNAFNAAHGGIHSAPCHIQYNPQTGLFSMVSESSYATAANPAKVYFETQLYKYIDTIPALFHGFNQPASKEFQIDFEVRSGNSNAWIVGNPNCGVVPNPQTDPPDFIIMEQETDSRELWSNITQILVTSNSINVRDQYLPYRVKPQQINNKAFDNFNQPKRSVLSYIDYNTTKAATTLQSSLVRDLNYNPKYRRWIDLVSNDSLNNINVEYFYVINGQTILPLTLPVNGTADVSLLFRKKN